MHSSVAFVNINSNMAARNNKRRATDFSKSKPQNDEELSEDISSDEVDGSDHDDAMETEIQVDFEARSLEVQDQEGVKSLLRQLFLTEENIVLGLSEVLFAQKDIGSVIKQSEIPEDSDDEDDEGVFGLISVVNITEKKNTPSVQQLREFLISKAKETGDDVVYTTITRILNDDSNHVGFVICERFVNIPSIIAPLMYESLRSEIETAKSKKSPFNFSYYILISKILQSASNSTDDDIYINQEDKTFVKDSLVNFKFKLEDETATAMEGKWNGEDELTKSRRVLCLKFDKFNFVVENMKKSLEN